MALPLNLNIYGAIIAPAGSLSSSYTFLSSGGGGVSAAVAGGVMLGADTLFGIWMPPVWTAAGITFQVSPDGGTTWLELYDDAGNEVAITTPAAGTFVALQSHPGSIWYGINAIKVRSGTSASPVTQTPGCTVNLIGRPINY